jgi:hypothetical protein
MDSAGNVRQFLPENQIPRVSCGIWRSLCFISSGGALLLYQSSCRHDHLGHLHKLALITTREVDIEPIENRVIPYLPQLIIVLRDLPSCTCPDSKYGSLISRGPSRHSRATETATRWQMKKCRSSFVPGVLSKMKVVVGTGGLSRPSACGWFGANVRGVNAIGSCRCREM